MKQIELLNRIYEHDYDPILVLAAELNVEGISEKELHSLLKNTEYCYSNPIGNKLINAMRDLKRK